jgi:hypothetical protein
MKELYEIGEIGRMERQHQVTDLGSSAFLERGLDGVQEVGANAPILVAQFDLGCGVLHGLPNRRVDSVKREGPRSEAGIDA